MNRDTLIAKLKDEIAAGRVVTVAGTGVSVAACGNQEVEGFRVATWTGLLQHGVKHLVDIGAANDKVAGLLEMQVESGETDLIINAAETISQRMKARSDGTFRGWLKDTIGGLKIRDRLVPDALAALPGVLATLNYDNLLEDATGRHAVTSLKTDAVQDVLARVDPDAVLHLHGWFREPESVVLGLGSYLAVKDHPHARAVLELFTIDRTLLFVGCGDTVLDPNFTRLIEWGREALRDVAPRHYLLCRTSELAGVRKKLAGSWLQPLDYGADYTDLAPFLRGLAPPGAVTVAAEGRIPARVSFDLAAYQQAMRKRYARLKLEELDPTTHDVRPLTLTGMFIEQSAREAAEFMPRVFELPKEVQRRLREQGEMEGGALDEELLAQHRRAYLDQSLRPILEVVRDPALRRLVVLGDPGSGKSTLLQYLLLDWAEKAAPDPGDEPLPLLIELREYARLRDEGTVDGFLDYLHGGASVRWHVDRAQLDAWLKDNPSRILFDGLNEVFDPTLRREVSTAIHRFADEYPLARIAVTSRIFGYQHQAWRDEHFRHFMLQELDEEQVGAFLARWHGAAYEEAGKGETKRALLADAIEHSAAIRQLAGNPLLLTMMAILNRTQDLPRDRAELYEQCARLLLHQWKVDAAFESDPELSKASLDYKDKRALLLRVARAMQTSEQGLAGNLIDEDTLERTLAEGLRGVPNLRPDRAARALIDQLRGRNFMLCSVGGRSYAFVHRTFLEYFCAVEIRERFQTEQSLTLDQLRAEVWGHWADETWHEVLSLLAGMLAPRFVAEILQWLLERPDPEDTCRHVFLAAHCISEVRRREEMGNVERRVLKRTRALIHFNPRHYGPFGDLAATVNAVHIRAVQTVATVWRETVDTLAWLRACALTDEDAAVRQSAVQELARGWRDDPETLAILKARAQSDKHPSVRMRAVQELARGWRVDLETLLIVKTRAQSDEHPSVRTRAVQELARGWRDDSDTLPILKAYAQSDQHPSVRTRAVRELARGWSHDPAIFRLLKARAESDPDAEVRESAVQELARGWRDDPETLLILKTHAQTDEIPAVRLSAVHELAHGWSHDPETLPILKARAQSDADAGVRWSAVQELARGWKDDPETLPILKARAQSDEDAVVRQSAVRELARGWKDDPETLPILKARAKSDEHPAVRLSAVQQLARGWKDDPETLPWLKARAESDANPAVRQSAVQELARGWKDDPEILLILKTRAQADEDAAVRQSAVQELARDWKDDPETLPLLKARARSDENWAMRVSAVQELARGWKDDPETLPWLLELAMKDPSDDVRVTTLELVAQEGWRDVQFRTNLRTDLLTSPSVDAVARTYVASIEAHAKVARFWARKLCGEFDDGPEPQTLPGYPALRVAQFRLRDIGPFEDTGRIELDRGLNVFLGDNASGKTTILKCLALAAVGISAANEVEKNASSYLRKGARKGKIEVMFEVVPDPGAPVESSTYFMAGLEIAADSTRFAALVEEERTLDDSPAPEHAIRDAGESLGSCRTDLTMPFGFISAYGVVRTFSTSRFSIQSELPRKENEWVISLFDTDAPLVNPEVLAKLLRGDTSNIENAPTRRLSAKVTSSLIRSFKHIMPEVESWADGDHHDLRLAGVDLRLGELSDGYRSVLALMAHLVRCSLKVENWEGDPTGIDGIVLVDEMDLHLHPSWQRRVLQDFRRAWPNLQIIASTHSPLIVGTLKREHIFVVRRADGAGATIQKPATDAQGLGVAGVLTDVFELALTLDEPTLAKITERLTLHARREAWTEAERDRYTNLSDELAKLGFNRDLFDPYFAHFAAAIARRYGARLGDLSPAERRDLDSYADELLSNMD